MKPPAIADGFAQTSVRAGNGLDWNRDAVERYRIA